MLPGGNDEIPGNQLVEEASQNKVLPIYIQIPTERYMTRTVEAALSELPPVR